MRTLSFLLKYSLSDYIYRGVWKSRPGPKQFIAQRCLLNTPDRLVQLRFGGALSILPVLAFGDCRSDSRAQTRISGTHRAGG